MANQFQHERYQYWAISTHNVRQRTASQVVNEAHCENASWTNQHERVVLLKTKNGVIKRTITKLYRLPVQNETE